MRMRLALTMSLTLWLGLAGTPAQAAVAAPAPQTLHLPAWGDEKLDHFGVVTLHMAMPARGQKGVIALTVASPGARPFILNLPHDPDDHEFPPHLSRVEMDGANATPEFLVSRFTGGAHCCTHLTILDQVAGQWIAIDGGSWDGGDVVPEDADGDGELEIVHGDDRFLYVFSCYACAGSPARYFKVVEGALTDITASPLFRHRDEKQLPAFQRGCARHDNEACASYVAIMTRLDRHDEGWQFMLKNYDPNQDWGLTDCAQRNTAGNCTAEIKYKSYPEALEALIRRTNEWQPGAP